MNIVKNFSLSIIYIVFFLCQEGLNIDIMEFSYKLKLKYFFFIWFFI